MKKVLPLVALAAMSLAAACSHHGARSFSIASPAPQPHDPSPSAPDPAPTPTADNDGTLTRTVGGVTNVVGGVLHVAGNATLGLGDTVGAKGLGGVPVVGAPVEHLVQTVDGHLNGVTQVQVVNLPIAGATTPSGNQAIGVSALSQTPSTGAVATVGVLNQGSQQPVSVSVGGAQVLGGAGPAAVNVGLLNGATPPLGAPPPGAGNPLAPVGGVISGVTGGVGNTGAGNNGGGQVNLIGKHP